jgi:hypothetical protein
MIAAFATLAPNTTCAMIEIQAGFRTWMAACIGLPFNAESTLAELTHDKTNPISRKICPMKILELEMTTSPSCEKDIASSRA